MRDDLQDLMIKVGQQEVKTENNKDEIKSVESRLDGRMSNVERNLFFGVVSILGLFLKAAFDWFANGGGM